MAFEKYVTLKSLEELVYVCGSEADNVLKMVFL